MRCHGGRGSGRLVPDQGAQRHQTSERSQQRETRHSQEDGQSEIDAPAAARFRVQVPFFFKEASKCVCAGSFAGERRGRVVATGAVETS